MCKKNFLFCSFWLKYVRYVSTFHMLEMEFNQGKWYNNFISILNRGIFKSERNYIQKNKSLYVSLVICIWLNSTFLNHLWSFSMKWKPKNVDIVIWWSSMFILHINSLSRRKKYLMNINNIFSLIIFKNEKNILIIQFVFIPSERFIINLSIVSLSSNNNLHIE